MKQRYEVWVGESRSTMPQPNCAPDFYVMAEKHRQHIYSETVLIGASRIGAAKINALVDRHWLCTSVGNRIVRLRGAEVRS